ncbi:MAG: hypothetical protein MJK12_12970 [Colwellia sp.]|nr:hypothetical protein [Colwellia sp.]
MSNIAEHKRRYYLNKVTIQMFFIVTSLGCSNAQEEPNEFTPLGIVEQDAKSAVNKKDFRLYATSGRRITFPGIDNNEYIFVEEVCGKKYFPQTGDVINSEQQRKQRKMNINYMEVYNKKMLVVCRNQ